MSNLPDPEYVSHATLMILGRDLDPSVISTNLRLRPTQSWQRGDTKSVALPGANTLAFASVHEWGGWKKTLPASHATRPLPGQLHFWIRTLHGRSKVFERLSASGHHCALDCYVGTAATASMILSPDLQRELAALGLELRLSVFAGPPEVR